jgi:hypothetical protein
VPYLSLIRQTHPDYGSPASPAPKHPSARFPIIGLSLKSRSKNPQLPVQPSLHAHSLTTRQPSSARLAISFSPGVLLVGPHIRPGQSPRRNIAVSRILPLCSPTRPVTSTRTAASPLYGGCAQACSPDRIRHAYFCCATRQSAAFSRAITTCDLRPLKVDLGITTFRSCFTPRQHPRLRPSSQTVLTFDPNVSGNRHNSRLAPATRPVSTAALCSQHGAAIPRPQRKKWPVGLVRAARVLRTSPTARSCTAP